MKVMKAPAMKAPAMKAATGPTMKDSHPNKLKHVFCFGFKTSSAFLLSELIEELKQLIKKQYNQFEAWCKKQYFDDQLLKKQYKQFEAYCKKHDHTADDHADRKRFDELVKQNKSLNKNLLTLKTNQELFHETLNNLITAHNELRDEVKGKNGKGKGKGKGKDKK